MPHNVTLSPLNVTPKKYHHHILGLKIDNYLKDKGTNASILNYPFDLKLLYMEALSDTNEAYELLGSNQRLTRKECEDDIVLINREINTVLMKERTRF